MKQEIIKIEGITTDYVTYENGDIYSNKTNNILKGTIYNSGYKIVRLTIGSVKKKGYAVHRLIAQAFIPNPNNFPVVNHKDGNKLNNNVNNLEWVTYSKNRIHAIENNLAKKAYGKRNKQKNIIEDGVLWKKYKDTNYLISKNGKVYNTKTNILLKQTPRQDGYIIYTLRINGKNKNKQAHVLVMETWDNNYNSAIDNIVINHKDGNKANNNFDNLEILSKRENALHACYKLNKIVKPVIRYNDKKVAEYRSITEAAKLNSVTLGAIVFAIKNSSKCNNYYWKYK